ncbi:MAG: aryl-alcohol dehydrogenase-like predicted oxidoreductase [Candidatus Endobugula sp.]|jgi:aryl-alcohol dehydrogenase-like predicted oxidoreductase
MMKYRLMPKANLKVSEISFGCMSLDLKNNGNERLIHAAIESGVNYFDTADLYDKGENERLIGRALRPNRNELIIATKVGNQWSSDTNGWVWNPTKDYILKACDESLKRLQTDYIDVYQLHGGTIEDNREEVVEAFEILKTQGKIRHYGLSSIRPNVIRDFVSNANISTNMLQYSLLDRRSEESVLSLLQDNGIGIMVRGALAKGVLAGKESIDYLGYGKQSIDLLLNKMSVFSTDKTALSHIAVQWVLKHPAVTSVVLGMRTQNQLTDALNLYESSKLTADDLGQIGAVLKPHIYNDHR